MARFWQKKYTSKYTGAEIDAAVAKAGTVPAVTVADAGKTLVVDAEGKIVPGAIYPVFELSDTEWGEISTAFGTFLYSLTADAGLVRKNFVFETNAASVIEKIKAVVNSGAPLVYDKLPADYGGLFLLGIIGANGFVTFATSNIYPAPINKRILVCFDIAYNQAETQATFTVTAQVVTNAS